MAKPCGERVLCDSEFLLQHTQHYFQALLPPCFLHSLEQCGSVLELLKQYQNFKNNLTALIQKEESIISQQASYMGRDNLKKKVAEVSPPCQRAVLHGDLADEPNRKEGIMNPL